MCSHKTCLWCSSQSISFPSVSLYLYSDNPESLETFFFSHMAINAIFFFALSLISLSDVHFCKYLPLSAESLLYWKLLLYIYSPVLHAAKLYAWGVRHQGTVKDGFVWRPQYPSTPARLGMEWQPDSAWSPGHWSGPWRWCQDGDTDPKIWQPDLPEQGSHGVHMKCAELLIYGSSCWIWPLK